MAPGGVLFLNCLANTFKHASYLHLGSIPSPEHLEEVKYCLVRIQSVLVQILRFWNHVSEILKKLEQQTFAGTDLLEDLESFKEIYLYSICEAEKVRNSYTCRENNILKRTVSPK